MEIENEALEKYRHMSFIRERHVGYQKFETFRKAKSLRTFLSVSSEVKNWGDFFFLSNKILVDLLPELPLLRVLSLSCFWISELPEFIGSLKHLRYLNLSETNITELPENVGNLYNLQTLIVFGCHRLSKLPTSFLKLKNLRHFDIRDTPLLEKMPLGIGELKNLQTTTKIIIGGDDGFALTELKKIKNLRGKTSIEGLETVTNATYARDMNFSENRLTEIELKWDYVFDDSRNETLEKEVINELKPRSDKLKRLKIMAYGGIPFPNWVGDPSFIRLVQVSIVGCRKCASLPTLAQLPSLKELYIEAMDEVIVVGSELPGTITGVAFPSLEILRFRNMQGWEVWSTNSGIVFPRLQELYIINCRKLVEVSLEEIPSLRVLEINGCGYGVLRSMVRAASSVTKLDITYILGLTGETWKCVMMYLGAVEELKINLCKEIRYLWESEAEASKFLVKLRKLVVWNCPNLVSLGEKDEDDGDGNCGSKFFLTSLTMLDISACRSMKHFISRNSIESLTIDCCRSITSDSFPSRMPMLEYLKIVAWTNLKFINESSFSIHLTSMTIQDCQRLESFPDKELRNLTSLKRLVIVGCPSMDASFPRGNWPPKLCTLEIGELKKPVSEWGNQNFPTSLDELELFGKGDDGCLNISQLSNILPPSLIELRLRGFEKLKSLSVGLQHLTSLQHLRISICPNIIDLPETLLPSLLSLKINRCPTLEERTSGTGSEYWPLISHIPFVSVRLAHEHKEVDITEEPESEF